MTKLTYTNDQQIINDVAQFILEEHLDWSGTLRRNPSEVHGIALNRIFDAYAESIIDPDEFDELDRDTRKEMRKSFESKSRELYAQAQAIADKKWEAAKVLLGF